MWRNEIQHFLDYLRNVMPAMTSAASKSVCITMTPIGAGPTSASAFREVFTPSAATAVSRHQLDTGVNAEFTSGETQPILLTITRTTKATRNHGSSGRLSGDSARLRWVISEIINTTGTRQATRMSFTSVDISPV